MVWMKWATSFKFILIPVPQTELLILCHQTWSIYLLENLLLKLGLGNVKDKKEEEEEGGGGGETKGLLWALVAIYA